MSSESPPPPVPATNDHAEESVSPFGGPDLRAICDRLQSPDTEPTKRRELVGLVAQGLHAFAPRQQALHPFLCSWSGFPFLTPITPPCGNSVSRSCVLVLRHLDGGSDSNHFTSLSGECWPMPDPQHQPVCVVLDHVVKRCFPQLDQQTHPSSVLRSLLNSGDSLSALRLCLQCLEVRGVDVPLHALVLAYLVLQDNVPAISPVLVLRLIAAALTPSPSQEAMVTRAVTKLLQAVCASDSQLDWDLSGDVQSVCQRLLSELPDSTPQPPVKVELSFQLSQDRLQLKQLVQDEMQCSVCYSLLHSPVTTSCGHTFCRQCLCRTLDHNNRCPKCRNLLSELIDPRRQIVNQDLLSILRTVLTDEDQARQQEIQALEEGEFKPIFVCNLMYPGVRCPLHIFEPRYRLMIRRAMESARHEFGMAMYGGPAGYADIGTMAEITNVRLLPDGRLLIDTIGGRRFRVVERGGRDGYNTAKVEFIEDEPLSAEEHADLATVDEQVRARIDALHLPPRMLDAVGEAPADAKVLAFWTANWLPLPESFKYRLLAMTNALDRARMVLHCLHLIQAHDAE